MYRGRYRSFVFRHGFRNEDIRRLRCRYCVLKEWMISARSTVR
jgi:hypothetical protein